MPRTAGPIPLPGTSCTSLDSRASRASALNLRRSAGRTRRMPSLGCRQVGIAKHAPSCSAVAALKGAELSAFVADLDHFKLINDTPGHAALDVVVAQSGPSHTHD